MISPQGKTGKAARSGRQAWIGSMAAERTSIDDRSERLCQSLGAPAGALLGVMQRSPQAEALVGDVERREDRDPHRIDGAGAPAHLAHLGVDVSRDLHDVLRVGPGSNGIALTEDLDVDRGRLVGHGVAPWPGLYRLPKP